MSTADLDLDLDLVCGVARDLDHALVLVCALDRAFDLALVHALEFELEIDLDRALDLIRDLHLGLVSELKVVRELEGGLDLELDLDRALTLEHDLVCRLAVDLDFARSLVREIEIAHKRDRDHDYDLDRALNNALALAEAFDVASGLAGRLVATIEDRERPVTAKAVRSRKPMAVAARLVRGVVRVLPAAARGRYDEEFGAELYDLTVAGASRWAQLEYALRLLDRAWLLRAELHEATAKRVRS